MAMLSSLTSYSHLCSGEPVPAVCGDPAAHAAHGDRQVARRQHPAGGGNAVWIQGTTGVKDTGMSYAHNFCIINKKIFLSTSNGVLVYSKYRRDSGKRH